MKEIQIKAVNQNGPSENEVINKITGIAAFLSAPILFTIGFNFWEKAAVKKHEEIMRRCLSEMECLLDYVNIVGDIRVKLGEPLSTVPRYELTYQLHSDDRIAVIMIKKTVDGKSTEWDGGKLLGYGAYE